MTRKNIIILSSIIFVLLIFFVFFMPREDTWICKNGEWIKHGNPSIPMPATSCEENKNIGEGRTLVLYNFREGDILQTGYVIEGKTKDNFFFEGTFPILIQDLNGSNLGNSFAQSKTDWMTSDYVEFATEPLNFDKKDNKEGYLIFKKDNPSGLSENDKEIKIKVRF